MNQKPNLLGCEGCNYQREPLDAYGICANCDLSELNEVFVKIHNRPIGKFGHWCQDCDFDPIDETIIKWKVCKCYDGIFSPNDERD